MAEDQNLHSIVRSLLGLSSSDQPMETNALIRELATRIVASGLSFAETTGTATLGASLLWTPDNTYDIGATGATRPRDLHLGRNALIGGTLGITGIVTGRDYTVITNTETGAQNNWAPSGMVVGNTVVLWSGASAMSVTGIAGGSIGQTFTFYNLAASTATFAYNSGSSSAGNKLINLATSAVTPVATGGWIQYVHDGTQWRVVAHEQGAWITPTFSAGDFTAVTAGTWTVASGDVATMAHRLSGKTLNVAFSINTTSIAQSGGSPTQVQVATGQLGGFTWASTVLNLIRIIDNNNLTTGHAISTASGTTMVFQRTDGAQFASATDTTYFQGALMIPVT